ncbi:ComF family protein [Lactobacillus sp. ESL0701]|uniref:ComF family protein n=1 Tax=Lactobacillus sp. ESL0701 TaxID=2983217 RepID=UPI0023FA14B3|nr:ComF family protein [Lactobacillus sp. ESL0701]MDF7672355.1 ComF family protein [Lactobacillus sp. ESL0701]
MNSCLLCGQQFAPAISLRQVFSWQKVHVQRICPRCRAKFQSLPDRKCPVCAGELAPNGVCLNCRTWRKIYGSKLLHHYAVLRYNDAAHDLMVNYKRYGDYVLRAVLQELCDQELKQVKADYYVPIPTSVAHLEKRQFDTISAIYDEIVPLTPILLKSGDYGAQGSKNRTERLKSGQTFGVNHDLALDFNQLNQRKILLLDDIYTTGRTLYHARDALSAVFPAARIESFSIYR